MNRNRYAVCVGVNEYGGAASDLNGCVSDALDWSDLLHDRGYDVDVLLDSQATKSRVLGALGWAVRRARYGDRIVFTASCHGSWVPDQNGDEPDRRDEVLVCHDYDVGGLITDDELYDVFQRKPFGVRATIISDSCHSGTVSRFFGDDVTAARRRFLSPADLGLMSRDEAMEREALPAHKPRLGAVLLSGCDDHEYSYDAFIDGRYRGAFTAKALDALEEQPHTLRDWHDEIRTRLPSTDYPQTPQLQGTAWQKRWRPLA